MYQRSTVHGHVPHAVVGASCPTILYQSKTMQRYLLLLTVFYWLLLKIAYFMQCFALQFRPFVSNGENVKSQVSNFCCNIIKINKERFLPFDKDANSSYLMKKFRVSSVHAELQIINPFSPILMIKFFLCDKGI